MLSLGDTDKKRIIDSDQNERIIHSLESVSFLKLAKDNKIVFSNQKMEKREIQIQ